MLVTMRARHLLICLGLAVLASACSKTPVAPSGPVSVTTASLTSPSNGASIPNLSQPVTLSITNATVTSADAVLYTFEVASDVLFATKIVTQDVAQGSGTTTSLTLGTLPPGADYYWRTRTKAGGTTGVFSTPLKFSIGAQIIVQPPIPIAPLSGGPTLAVLRPTFTITNAIRSGPVTAIAYRFDVSTTSTFTAIVASGTVAEGNGTTSFTPNVDLPGATTFFWRAQSVDTGSGVTSNFSVSQTFTTQVVINLNTVNYQRFVNIANWPVTNTIIAVEQDGSPDASPPGPMCINHTKRGIWPTSDFFGDPLVQVEGNQWYFAFINGVWYGGSGENMRPNQICKQGQMSEAIGPDGTWGGPMDTWRPRRGELVGYAMTTPARFWPSMKTLDERSNIVIQPWVDTRVGPATIK
jgi:hypothetical protein